VTWQVVFANPIDGLTPGNLTLVNTGLGGTPTITGIMPTSPPPATTWNITASTGSGQGTLGLNLANDAGLSHTVTNLTFTGEVFDIDHIAPTTTSFTRLTPATSPTNADTLVFSVIFSEKVTGVSADDFAVTGTTATITAINSGGTISPSITIDGGDLAGFNGVVGLTTALPPTSPTWRATRLPTPNPPPMKHTRSITPRLLPQWLSHLQTAAAPTMPRQP